MPEVELLLSDEFVVFSQKITEIHAEKKSKKAELKSLYDKMKTNSRRTSFICSTIGGAICCSRYKSR